MTTTPSTPEGLPNLPTSREAFEAWGLEYFNYGFRIERNSEGDYEHDGTDTAWCAWQAAIAAQQEKIGPALKVQALDGDMVERVLEIRGVHQAGLETVISTLLPPQKNPDHLDSGVGGGVTQWQPIATAPKDGTPVMLWSEARRGSWIGKWVDTYGSGFRPDNAWFSLMLNCHWHPNQYEALRPTHWMPLPAAPTGEGA